MQVKRYVALDSWRGVAALSVVAFHFRTTAGFDGVAIFNGMYMFVDFFFVLSGFVIYSSYGAKLRNGYGILRFMWLRVGRVYPLHIAILIGFIALQMLIVYPRTGDWFPAPTETWGTILANILLVQSLNLYDFLTWNEPSWSISVEFFTYILFAVAITGAGRLQWLLCLVVLCVAPAFLFFFNAGKNLDTTATYGLVRCIYGFSSGVVAYELYSHLSRLRGFLEKNPLCGSTTEFAIVMLIAAFIATANTSPLSLLAPILFGASVIIFAAEAGIFSKLMLCRPLVFLGAISYSIYMVHMLVISWWLELFRAALFKIGGRKLFETVDHFARSYVFLAERNYPGLALMLLVVVAVSATTYVFIEKPSREWSRRRPFFERAPGGPTITEATPTR
ncbi:acyltransferase family protein [Rhizobium laguerreae]|uniref:Peptidoglycan/LPS O-acetylase OafA/YrhL n=1 Tax=Rhizobium laguerreae TaxID=1076926 RepID=A0AAX2QA97_9HYPH|nr:acyltransferase [Rhizobium laguerreae]TCU11984.1 peptidoglycan/LPS O-acetylase OafA/YrhL [Rhizobium laguerreae]